MVTLVCWGYWGCVVFGNSDGCALASSDCVDSMRNLVVADVCLLMSVFIIASYMEFGKWGCSAFPCVFIR